MLTDYSVKPVLPGFPILKSLCSLPPFFQSEKLSLACAQGEKIDILPEEEEVFYILSKILL